jgi:hypothetical protein
LHFAFTITFHDLFPQLTMGLALLIVILKTLALRSDEVCRRGCRLLADRGKRAGAYGLKIGLVWWVTGMILATVYSVRVYRSFAGKVGTETDRHGYAD